MNVNKNYQNIADSYLFSTIAKKDSEFAQKNPDKKIIVLTHFLPTPQGIAEKYRNDALNPYFTSNLEDFIKQHKNIKLWACGHTHIPFECKIGECKVVCEPYGYYGVDHWLQPKDYNGKIIEL